MDVLIITPLFFGDASGASVYYQQLTSLLAGQGLTVGVVSDRESGDYNGVYFSLFPRRAGRNKSTIRDYASYALQNASYRKLVDILSMVSPKNVIVHSSFYNLPGVFPFFILRAMRKFPDINFILDARDHLVPPFRVRYFGRYRSVIVCSENIRVHLLASGLSAEKITYIPVIQEHLDSLAASAPQALAKYGLQNQRYIFYAGLIKEVKRVDVLHEAFINYVSPAMPDVKLVLAGLMKTTSEQVMTQLQHEQVMHLGSLPRKEVIALMQGAALCVNISPIEGLPRSSLEALALRKPVLLPPNVPEFMQHCRDHVAVDEEAEKIAAQMMRIMQDNSVPEYPIERHYAESQLSQYMKQLVL